MDLRGRLLSAAVIAAGLLSVDQGALAQTLPDAATAPAAEPTAFDTLVVTARKRDEAAQSVPISIDVLDQKQVDRLGIKTLEDLRFNAPSFYAAPLDLSPGHPEHHDPRPAELSEHRIAVRHLHGRLCGRGLLWRGLSA